MIEVPSILRTAGW